MAELRKLAEHCEFGDSLNEMLRDCLVCGINDHQIQRRLLSEPKLSFSQALQIAQAAETAHRNTKELEKLAEVHVLRRDSQSVNETRGPPKPPACLRCGGQHSAATCQFGQNPSDTQAVHCSEEEINPRKNIAWKSREARTSWMR